MERKGNREGEGKFFQSKKLKREYCYGMLRY